MLRAQDLDFPELTQPAACATPEALPLVDAAFIRPGGTPGDEFRKRYCLRCPALVECLDWGMTHHEYGVWGGASPNLRTRHGAPGSDPAKHKRRTAAA